MTEQREVKSFDERLKDAVKAISGVKIPVMPGQVFRLQDELKSRFVNSVTVADIIEQDTIIAGEVLKLINSPIMKMKVHVRSIREAVNMLGLDNIRNLVVSSVISRVFGSDPACKEIIEHSVDVAFCMAELSEWVDGVSRDEAYMMGLFHNGGGLLLATKDPENYPRFLNYAHSMPISLLEKENKRYGSDHTMVGVLLAKKWQLPVDMISAIMLHHEPKCAVIKNDKVRAYVALIKVSNAIVSEISLGAYRGQEMRDYEKDGEQELMIPHEMVKRVRIALMSYGMK